MPARDWEVAPTLFVYCVDVVWMQAARAEREAKEAQRRPLLAAKEKAEKELSYLEAERKR